MTRAAYVLSAFVCTHTHSYVSVSIHVQFYASVSVCSHMHPHLSHILIHPCAPMRGRGARTAMAAAAMRPGAVRRVQSIVHKEKPKCRKLRKAKP